MLVPIGSHSEHPRELRYMASARALGRRKAWFLKSLLVAVIAWHVAKVPILFVSSRPGVPSGSSRDAPAKLTRRSGSDASADSWEEGASLATGAGRGHIAELWPQLYKWMQDDGMDMSDIAIEVAPVDVGQSGELGLVAKSKLMPGDILAWAPTSLLLNKPKAVDLFGADVEELPDRTAVALLLIYERFVRQEKSKWRIYWSACPSFETDCVGPSFLWKEDEWEWLRGSDAYEASVHMRAVLEGEFMNLREALFAGNAGKFPEDVFTLEHYLWASAVVASRAYGDDADGTNLAIAPLVDFINHQPGALQMTRFGNGIVAYAHRAYDPGEQVWINYGGKSNAELLSQYGFVVDDNRYDAIYLRMGHHLQVPDTEWKLTLLREILDGAEPESGIFKVSCNPREWQARLVPALRVMAYSDSEEEDLPSCVKDLYAPQNRDVEAAAWGMLEEALQAREAEYPASWEEDRKKVLEDDKLASSDPTSSALLPERVKLALRLRVAEQDLLKVAALHASEQRAVVAASPSSSESEASIFTSS